MTTNSIRPDSERARRKQAVHNALTLCERNKRIDIEFQPSLPASRADAESEIAVGDIVTLRRDEESLAVAVTSVVATGLFEGTILRFGSDIRGYREMSVGDGIIFQALHVFACKTSAL